MVHLVRGWRWHLGFAVTILLVATFATSASAQVEQVADIIGEEACLNGEAARRLTVRASASNEFDVGLFVQSDDPTHYEIDALLGSDATGFYSPGESRSYALPVSEYDFDTWNLFADPDGDASFLDAVTVSASADCDYVVDVGLDCDLGVVFSWSGEGIGEHLKFAVSMGTTFLREANMATANSVAVPFGGPYDVRVEHHGGDAFLLDLLEDFDGVYAEPAECDAPANKFVDDNGHIFENAITWLSSKGITEGCNPPTNNRFCPDDAVTRGQMAVFLVRAFNYTDNGGGNLFVDDNGMFYENSADRLFTAGVTQGCNPPRNNRFCGEQRVTRGQMAAVLARAFDLPAYNGPDRFTDDNGHIFEGAIERLAQAGITLGCNPPTNNRFCPDQPVTRGQMAAFLKRAFGE